ncbi:MAG: hypothetical protein WCO56_11395 [Verrucomicrobiota bacterium]
MAAKVEVRWAFKFAIQIEELRKRSAAYSRNVQDTIQQEALAEALKEIPADQHSAYCSALKEEMPDFPFDTAKPKPVLPGDDAPVISVASILEMIGALSQEEKQQLVNELEVMRQPPDGADGSPLERLIQEAGSLTVEERKHYSEQLAAAGFIIHQERPSEPPLEALIKLVPTFTKQQNEAVAKRLANAGLALEKPTGKPTDGRIIQPTSSVQWPASLTNLSGITAGDWVMANRAVEMLAILLEQVIRYEMIWNIWAQMNPDGIQEEHRELSELALGFLKDNNSTWTPQDIRQCVERTTSLGTAMIVAVGGTAPQYLEKVCDPLNPEIIQAKAFDTKKMLESLDAASWLIFKDHAQTKLNVPAMVTEMNAIWAEGVKALMRQAPGSRASPPAENTDDHSGEAPLVMGADE